jgi:dTDP-glucose pyrophosphorylase/mRNA-degrading endonuclease RelE of RelBE toxin-antitoxin system
MNDLTKHLILKGSTIKEALARLDLLGQDAILFVVDKNDMLIGALTDGDVRRGLLKNIQINENIDNIIQPNPRFIKKGEYDLNKLIEFREGLYRIIPIVNEQNKVIKIINFRERKSYLPIDAVIMAGGRGQRLMPLTTNIPKPLLKVGEKPIIEHNINRLVQFGIDDFWISINYLGELIENYFENGVSRNINIKYVKEEQPLGTIGAVTLIDDFQHEFILITNSDLLTNLNYEHFFLEFIKSGADIAVVTIPYNVNVPYAVFEIENCNVVNFKEKPTYTFYSNGGIYLIKKSILKMIPNNYFYNATDLLQKLIYENKKIFSYPLMDYWLDVGSHDDYAKAQTDIKNIRF